MDGEQALVVASNRGPVTLVTRDGEMAVVRGGGGMTTGIASAVTSGGGLWLCSALNDQERRVARDAHGAYLSTLGIDTGGIDVRMLPIEAATFDLAYNGIANSTLWFINHLLYDTPRSPVFDMAWRRKWAAYEQYNATFAGALRAEAAPGGTVMIQDYHLFLAPRMLREQRPDLSIGHFTHTPWAPPEYFAMLPDDVCHAVLAGMLGADHLGFHCHRWAAAFLECCAELLRAEVDPSRSPATVRYRERVTRVGVHPLGTDGVALRARADHSDVTGRVNALRSRLNGRRVIGRVDRTELSKNIVRGMLAYQQLLRTRPQWRGEVTHVVYAYPSRQDVAEYREYMSAVHRLAREIEQEFGTAGWQPLVLEVENDYPGSLAALRCTEVLLVNPTRDGMNLVAQEGAILAEAGCALVLSREAGAIDMLGADSLVVNPFDIGQTADALHAGLSMPEEERRARGARLAAAATALPPADWFAEQVTAARD